MSVGLILYHDGYQPRWRKPVPLDQPLGAAGLPLVILWNRLRGIPGVDGPVLLAPDQPEETGLVDQARSLGVEVETWPVAGIGSLPWSISPERWGMEDDFGLGTWAGTPLVELAVRRRWENIIVLPVTNLLVDRATVEAGLSLHRREGFPVTLSFDRPPGANWTILSVELLQGLQNSHPDIMATRGGLTWILRKPLYPFPKGEFHSPRDRPRITADLRLVNRRVWETLTKAKDDSFGTPDFSYPRWLRQSGWEEIYCGAGPSQVFIEPTNQCVGKCVGCPNPSMQRARGSMTPGAFQALVEGLGPSFEGRFILSGMGEPFANPGLGEMAATIRGRPSLLVTSLAVAPPSAFPWEAFSHVRISIDALERQGFERMRPGCSWERIEHFVAMVGAAKAKDQDHFPEVGVSFVKSALTGPVAMAFLSYWGKVCVPPFKNHFFRWPVTEPPDKMQWYQVLGVSDFLGQIPFLGETRFCPVDRRPCLHALQGLHVLWDGTVVACPFDYEGKWPLGSLNRQSVTEIWSGEAARQFRRMHLALDFPDHLPCKTCQDWYHRT